MHTFGCIHICTNVRLLVIPSQKLDMIDIFVRNVRSTATAALAIQKIKQITSQIILYF